MERLTDEQLVELCLSGQDEAFAVLVKRYQNQIFSLAYRLGGDYDEAKDLAQEAFFKVYQELRSFDTKRKFFPWLYRVAHNTCINGINRRPKAALILDELQNYAESEAKPGSCPELSFEEKEASALLKKHLLGLPEQYRIPLLLKYIEGLTYQEISAKMDLPVTTIETRLYRGRQMLQKQLGKALHNL